MAQRLVFDKLETKRQTVEISFDGINYEEYLVESLKSDGLLIPEECEDYNNIKIKDKDNNEISNLEYLITDITKLGNKSTSFSNKIKKIKINSSYNLDNNILYEDEDKTIIAYLDNKNDNYIDIPNTVTEIKWCNTNSNLTFVGASLSIIKNYFYNIPQANIKDNITSIDNFAFNGWNNLQSISFPSSVTSIGDEAFKNCTSLRHVGSLNNLVNIGNYAFYNCGLTSIGSTRTLNDITFCSLPQTITSIGDHAFEGCTLCVNIPPALSYIGSHAFFGSTLLIYENLITEMTVISDNYSADANAIYNRTQDTLIDIYNSEITTYSFPSSVTNIYSYAFYKCTKLTSISIPNKVTSIEHRAFSCCSNLSSVTLPNNIEQIDEYTFSECTSLTSITIPASVQYIRRSAFLRCSNLRTITFASGSQLREIAKNAFKDCVSISSINIPSDCYIVPDAFSGSSYDFHTNSYVDPNTN